MIPAIFECPICFEPYDLGDGKRRPYKICSVQETHVVCQSCFDEVVKECPVCRQDKSASPKISVAYEAILDLEARNAALLAEKQELERQIAGVVRVVNPLHQQVDRESVQPAPISCEPVESDRLSSYACICKIFCCVMKPLGMKK